MSEEVAIIVKGLGIFAIGAAITAAIIYLYLTRDHD